MSYRSLCLTQPQSLLIFAARSYGNFSFCHRNSRCQKEKLLFFKIVYFHCTFFFHYKYSHFKYYLTQVSQQIGDIDIISFYRWRNWVLWNYMIFPMWQNLTVNYSLLFRFCSTVYFAKQTITTTKAILLPFSVTWGGFFWMQWLISGQCPCATQRRTITTTHGQYDGRLCKDTDL